MPSIPHRDAHNTHNDHELLALEARVGHQRALLTDRIRAFVTRFQSARALTRGNAMLIVLDYLVRHDDAQAQPRRADYDRVHELIRALTVRDATLALPGTRQFSDLTRAFSELAKLAADDRFPAVSCHGEIALPEVFCDAAALDLDAPLPGEKQACRILSRSESLAHVPMPVLAAAAPSLLRLLGIEQVLAKMGAARSAEDVRRDLLATRDVLARATGAARVLDCHLDALQNVLDRQRAVSHWMVDGLEALCRQPMVTAPDVVPTVEHGQLQIDSKAPVDLNATLGRQRTALHHYAVIFELRYQYWRAAESGAQIDKFRLMHRLRNRTAIDLSIKRIASYFCVAMRYSPRMRGSTRLHTLDPDGPRVVLAPTGHKD